MVDFDLTYLMLMLLIYFTDIAGLSPVGALSGHSLFPWLSKASAFSKKEHPDWVLSEYHGCNVNASTYMLRSGRWKYIAYADGLSVPPQLFGEPSCAFKKIHIVIKLWLFLICCTCSVLQT